MRFRYLAGFVLAVLFVFAPATGSAISATAAGKTNPIVMGGPPCTLTCPANITVSNNPNQCGALVNYPAPTIGGSCGTVTAAPASGSFFPVGTTTINVTSTAGPTCSFTITVNDTQPPTIVLPSSFLVLGSGPTTVVNYPPPVATDNCPGVSVLCVPASGSALPPGATTVTCTASDGATNTATGSFTINVGSTVPTLSWPAMIGLGILLAAIGVLLLRTRMA